MAKFVKLENGDLININSISCIIPDNPNSRLYMLEDGRLIFVTKKDVDNILKVSESDESRN